MRNTKTRSNGRCKPSPNLGCITLDCHSLTVPFFFQEKGEAVLVRIGEAEVPCNHHLFYEGVITRAVIEASRVLIEQGVRGTVFEEVQHEIRFRIRDIAQVDFGDDFVHIAHGSIQRMLENSTFGCASFNALCSLALIEAPPVLLDRSCVLVVFTH